MKYRICATTKTIQGNTMAREYFVYATTLAKAKREVNKIADVYFGELMKGQN